MTAARLGNVLYWLGCAGAVFGVGLAGVVALNPGDDAGQWMFHYILAGALAWLVGRGARYVLAGR